MSFHFYLYRAKEGLPAVNRWTVLHAEPLGPAGQLKGRLGALFPQLVWERIGDTWSGTGAPGMEPYLDILLSEDTPGQIHFVVLNKAPPSVMRAIMEDMRLNYACAPEAGDLVDPYAYEDGDRYYARRE